MDGVVDNDGGVGQTENTIDIVAQEIGTGIGLGENLFWNDYIANLDRRFVFVMLKIMFLAEFEIRI